MEKRQGVRRKCSISCRLVSRSLNLSGCIEDIADRGMNISLNPADRVKDVPETMTFVVQYRTRKGAMAAMQCRVRRAFRESPEAPVSGLGLEVISQQEGEEEVGSVH